MSQGHAPTLPTVSHELHSGANTRIPKRWLWVARVALLAISVLALVVYIAGTPANLAWFNSLHTDCLDACMTPANVQSLHALGISITAYAVYWTSINVLFALVYFAVAALIFWRRSDDWMAWLASFSLVILGAAFPSVPAALVDIHPAWWLPVAIVGSRTHACFHTLMRERVWCRDGNQDAAHPTRGWKAMRGASLSSTCPTKEGRLIITY